MFLRRGSGTAGPGPTLDETRLIDPEPSPRSARGLVSSTPGKLALIGVGLITIVLLAGALTSVAIVAREKRIDTLHLETGPLTNSAQELYSSLSIADAAATAGFLSGRVAPQAIRYRYRQAIGEASTALISAANGISANDTQSQELLAEISRGLSTYTGIASTARANSRVGNAVGVSYINESSALMHDTMLPAAQHLYTKQADAQANTQQSLARPPWTAIALCMFTLVALIGAQMYLTRLSHRRFNPGLIVASALMALLAIWLSIAGLLSANASANEMASAESMDALVRARILAQQARADETLGLLRRDSDTQSEQEYAQHTAELARILDGFRATTAQNDAADAQLNDAIAALDGWESAHRDQRQRLGAGDYVGAVDVAVGGGPHDAAAQFTRLDDTLESGIASLRGQSSEYIARSSSSLSHLDVGGATLGVLCGFAVGAGIWPRLSEYQ
ncbi:hypothetical protein DEU38_1299 [Rhodococcus sp. AG1013]|nr:hypothetical protein DEU38_1299 [Rhodococcus sp. AG1013]